GRLRGLRRRARRGRVWQASLGRLPLLLGSRLLLLSSLHSRLLFRRLKCGAVLIDPQYILPVPERLGNQEFTARNEVFHAHALAPGIASGYSNVAAQRDCIVKPRRYMKEANDIP